MGTRALLVMALTSIVCTSARARCLYGSDPDCYFPCNCAVPNECEQGPCVSGCRSNTVDYSVMWSGPTCQTGNVAFLKTCEHRGEAYYAADLAVDGRPQTQVGNKPHEYCSHQNAQPVNDPSDPAWWVVDLGDVHKVYNVTIYGRNACEARAGSNTWCEERLSQFTLRVGYADNYETGPVCGSHEPVVPLGGHVTVTCTTPLVGTHVYFVRTGGFEVGICSLCEVIVIGHKYVECHADACDGVCDEVTGCSSCKGAYKPDCKDVCEAGFYGTNCAETCGQCADITECDRMTGSCPTCDQWYGDDKCTSEIVPPVVEDETAYAPTTKSGSVMVQWDPLESVPSVLAEFYKYRVKYRVPGESLLNGSLVPHGPPPRAYEVSGLRHNTVYEFTVATYRVMGAEDPGESYDPITAKTMCNMPEVTDVMTVEVINGTEEALGPIMVWYEITDSGCDETSVVVIEYKHTSRATFDGITSESSNATVPIQPSRSGEHEVRIVATNNEGLSATSQTQTVTVIETRTNIKDDNLVAIVVPVVVVFLVLLGVGLGLFFWWRQRRQKNKSDTETDRPFEEKPATHKGQNENGSENHMMVVYDTPERPTTITEDASVGDQPVENIYANSAASSVVPVEEFEAYVNERKRNLVDFEAEYKSLPEEDLSKCTIAQTKDNLPKNRYKNIYAYDENRVMLEGSYDSESDYINANYITGFSREQEYIATQGARNTTATDFWRMIWQEKVNIIVMVANLVENGKGRCAEYWPETLGASVEFENVLIELESVEKNADYTTSILTARNGNKTRTVRHFHFKTWEDKSNPVYGIMSLLAFYNKIHAFDNLSKAPIVVHCSAGVGRTGTFIVLDILMQQAKLNKRVDVFSCVQRARQERMHMVQTLDQYYFIHDALVEFIKCGDTSISCANFLNKYVTLCAINAGTSALKQQFKVLCQMIKVNKSTDSEGSSPEHINKNRNRSVVPANFARPFLPGREEDSYINAVFVDSFKFHDFYIVTQFPLPHTQGDFWRLVHAQESTTVIMLNQPADQGENYWPTKYDQTVDYGGMNVTLKDTSSVHNNIVVRTFTVAKANRKVGNQSPLMVKHFQLLSWPDGSELPPQPGHLVMLREQVTQWHQESGVTKTSGNTIVQCFDGVSHSGLYCGLAYVMDKMMLEQEVDPFLAVRFVSRKRPEFFRSLEQYQFLYQMASDHMTQYTNEYANIQ